MTPLAPEDRAALVAELREAPLYNIDDEASAAPGEAADEIEALAARIEAMEARVPKAKPLEWELTSDGYRSGDYRLTLTRRGMWEVSTGESTGYYDTEYAAAAAAEADHQSRFKAMWKGWE